MLARAAQAEIMYEIPGYNLIEGKRIRRKSASRQPQRL